MSVNFSSPFNSSLDSVHSLSLNSTLGDSIIYALSATRLALLIPISIFVLHLGIQQWRQHHSFKTASHSDVFTYNLAVMELIWSLGTILSFSGVFSDFKYIILWVYLLYITILLAEIDFHVLTCLDRYLAVVHPVTYRKLRNTRGVTFRNISIFLVWLSLLLNFISHSYISTFFMIMFFIFFVASLIVVSFCSLSVLYVLFRPGPGAGGGNRGHIDRSKQRAFFTVMAIMGVLCFFFMGFLISSILMVFRLLCPSVSYVLFCSMMWFSLPGSLVLPLLYLHKTGKLPCGHKKDG